MVGKAWGKIQREMSSIIKLYSFHDPTPYENNHIKLPQLKINLKSEPDLIAFELTRRVYRKYGLSVTEIPFFDKENKLFIFGEQ